MGPPVTDEEILLQWLQDHDVECPLCQYNLRGLTTPRCPECGNAVHLSVTLVEPYLKAWITLTAAVSGGAGIGIFFLCLIARIGWPRGSTASIDMPIFLSFAMIPASVFAIWRQRSILRIPRSTQWGLAAAALFYQAVTLVLFVMTIR